MNKSLEAALIFGIITITLFYILVTMMTGCKYDNPRYTMSTGQHEATIYISRGQGRHFNMLTAVIEPHEQSIIFTHKDFTLEVPINQPFTIEHIQRINGTYQGMAVDDTIKGFVISVKYQ